MSTTSTLTGSPTPKGSSGTSMTEGSASSQKAQEDQARRERQERAWREAEKRRRGAHSDTWQGGIAPPAMGHSGAGN